MAKRPKKHHIIPKSYLINFTENQKTIWTFSKDKTPFPQSIDSYPVVKDRHTFQTLSQPIKDDEGNLLNPLIIESEILASGIESMGAGLIKKVINQGMNHITRGERYLLSVYIWHMYLRSPMFLDRKKEKFINAHYQTIKDLAKDKSKFYKAFEGINITLSEQDIENFRLKALELEKHVKIATNYHLFLLAEHLLSKEHLTLLNKMKWNELRTDGDFQFLIGLNNVIITYNESAIGLDLSRYDCSITFPISKNIALYLSWLPWNLSSEPEKKKMLAEVFNTWLINYNSQVFSGTKQNPFLNEILEKHSFKIL